MKGLALRCYLWMMHTGWAAPAAGALFACACALMLLGLPAERTALLMAQRHLAAANAALAAPHELPQTRQVATAQRLADFYGALGQYASVESQIGILFRTAAETGLTLRQAEYRAGFDRAGLFHTYQVVLPVRGPYRAIRQFCEQALNAIPFASLDDVQFKRGAIAESTVEAKLQFTLFLTDRKHTSAGAASMEKPNAVEGQ